MHRLTWTHRRFVDLVNLYTAFVLQRCCEPLLARLLNRLLLAQCPKPRQSNNHNKHRITNMVQLVLSKREITLPGARPELMRAMESQCLTSGYGVLAWDMVQFHFVNV